MPPPRKSSKPIIASKPSAPATPAPAAPIVERSEIKGSTPIKSSAPAARPVTHDMIAKRAYEIYAGRGYAPGDAHADWTEAERQLRAGL